MDKLNISLVTKYKKEFDGFYVWLLLQKEAPAATGSQLRSLFL